MTILYDLIFILFSIVYLPYLVFTGRYHKDIWQRFGRYPEGSIEALAGEPVIWIHAVSVGEVMASVALCEAIIRKYPDKRLVISTITKTGNDVAKKHLEGKATVIYLPVDLSPVVNRVLDRIRPSLFIIIETELWPNLIRALSKRKIPVVLVNGRISPGSYRHYKMIRPLFKGVLENMTLFCMQSEEYAERIKNIGAPAERVVVTGSIKFDAADTASKAFAKGFSDEKEIRRDLGLREDEMLLIAGSTHRPEENTVLEIYSDLLKASPGLRLLIAPRHIDRVPEIEALAKKADFCTVRASSASRAPLTANREPQTANHRAPVIILDTMGRLSRIFSIGTVIFIGGSLMPKGGQNILEPAIFSKAILFGPHMFNFKDIAEEFVSKDAACMVKDGKDLFKNLDRLLRDTPARESMGHRARALMEKKMGATGRTMVQLEKVFIL
ncbi:MAG: 3-deoxy-D-manno-octulosonic acid transferase [Candidatus Omnitrophota bacterium]